MNYKKLIQTVAHWAVDQLGLGWTGLFGALHASAFTVPASTPFALHGGFTHGSISEKYVIRLQCSDGTFVNLLQDVDENGMNLNYGSGCPQTYLGCAKKRFDGNDIFFELV